MPSAQQAVRQPPPSISDCIQGSIFHFQVTKECLEGAEIAFVRELTFEHIETDLAFRVGIVVGIDKAQRGAGINETTDEPRS